LPIKKDSLPPISQDLLCLIAALIENPLIFLDASRANPSINIAADLTGRIQSTAKL
jgi:hypothetical protein